MDQQSSPNDRYMVVDPALTSFPPNEVNSEGFGSNKLQPGKRVPRGGNKLTSIVSKRHTTGAAPNAYQ